MATNPARLIAPPATGRDWLKVVLVQLAALLEPAAGPWPAPDGGPTSGAEPRS
jgi:hypothetical protein